MRKLAAVVFVGLAVTTAHASSPGQPLDCSDWVMNEPGHSCDDWIDCAPNDQQCADLGTKATFDTTT